MLENCVCMGKSIRFDFGELFKITLPCEESFKKPEVNGVVNGVTMAN